MSFVQFSRRIAATIVIVTARSATTKVVPSFPISRSVAALTEDLRKQLQTTYTSTSSTTQSIPLEKRPIIEGELNQTLSLSSCSDTRKELLTWDSKVRTDPIIEKMFDLAVLSLYLHNRKDISKETIEEGSLERFFNLTRVFKCSLNCSQRLRPLEDVDLKVYISYASGSKIEVNAIASQSGKEYINFHAGFDCVNKEGKSVPVHAVENLTAIQRCWNYSRTSANSEAVPDFYEHEALKPYSNILVNTFDALPEHINPLGNISEGVFLGKSIEAAINSVSGFSHWPAKLTRLDGAQFVGKAKLGEKIKMETFVYFLGNRPKYCKTITKISVFNPAARGFEVIGTVNFTFVINDSAKTTTKFEEFLENPGFPKN